MVVACERRLGYTMWVSVLWGTMMGYSGMEAVLRFGETSKGAAVLA